jgi:hypothetical protein
MQLLNLMALVMGTVHRLMTVTVKQHKVREPIIRAGPIPMMDFHPIMCGEVQSTPSTLAALDPQEFLRLWRKARIPPQPQAPVGPIPIVGAASARDFGVPGHGRFRMSGKRLGLAEDNPPVFALPVPVHAPPIALVMMAPVGPSASLVVHPVVHLDKDGLCCDVGVVSGPAGNDRSQGLDQRRLPRAAMSSDQGARPLQVTLLGVPTGCDQRLKAEELTRTMLSASVSANGILADVEAEKVAPHVSLVGMQGVGDAGFARFESQTDVLQPPFCPILQGHERLQVTMQEQRIVSLSHHRRLPVAAMLSAWDAATQFFF